MSVIPVFLKHNGRLGMGSCPKLIGPDVLAYARWKRRNNL